MPPLQRSRHLKSIARKAPRKLRQERVSKYPTQTLFPWGKWTLIPPCLRQKWIPIHTSPALIALANFIDAGIGIRQPYSFPRTPPIEGSTPPIYGSSSGI